MNKWCWFNLAGLCLVVFTLTSACATKAQTGAAGGAGMGAIVGQIAGRDTKSTLIGAGVGAGVGYVIGNEMDKKEAREQTAEASQSTSHTYEDLAPLAGTRWQLTSLTPRSATAPYSSKIVEFQSNGRMRTTTTDTDGNVDVDQERYRVVGDTLIINQPGYLINAKYRMSGNELIVSAEKFSAVLGRLR